MTRATSVLSVSAATLEQRLERQRTVGECPQCGRSGGFSLPCRGPHYLGGSPAYSVRRPVVKPRASDAELSPPHGVGWLEWIFAGLGTDAPRPQATLAPVVSLVGKPSTRALGGLLRVVAEAEKGSRNDKLYWAACRLKEGGYPPAAADALVDAARYAGLDMRGIVATMRSAGVAP